MSSQQNSVSNSDSLVDLVDEGRNENDDYQLRDENQALSRAMTVNTLGFDNTNDEDSMSTAEDIDTFHPESKALTKNPTTGQDNEKEVPDMPELGRKETRFWSPNLKNERKKIFLHFLFIMTIIIIFCFTALVIMWGSMYKTSSYYHNIKIIALIQDDEVSNLKTSVVPITVFLSTIMEELPGTWHIFNSSTFSKRYNVSTTEEMNKRMIKLIYDEKYWLGLNVKPNITQSLYNSLTISPYKAFNSTDFFQVIYESARDPIHVHGFMVPIMQSLETAFQSFYSYDYIPSFINNITLINSRNVPYAGKISFEYLDYRQYYDRILFIVAQIGCVFALIFTVFQFIAYSHLHGEVTSLVKKNHKVYYRVGLSVLTHFVSSLFWTTVHAVYQADFTKAFGRGGFMVCWMTTWLFMWAVGGINENVLSVIFALNPPYLGFWVLGFVIINIASTFFPFALDSAFYRYGYFMPLHNFVAITRVIFMDISKHHMGRNYGVLVAWIGLNTAILPLDMKLVDWLVKRRTNKQKK